MKPSPPVLAGMEKLKLVRTLHSGIDKTRKLLFLLHRDSGPVTIEVGVIDKDDGKDILCVPTQTNCAQGCRFCFTTRMADNVPVLNLSGDEMLEIVRASRFEASLDWKKPLLVSFMGAGEPMANPHNLLCAMMLIRLLHQRMGGSVRFGLATMLPEKHMDSFYGFMGDVYALGLDVKVHLSLNYTLTSRRRQWMPESSTVHEAVTVLRRYRDTTGNPVEIHYTLIAGVNDSLNEMYDLGRLAAATPQSASGSHARGSVVDWHVNHKWYGPTDIPVKFLHLNPMPGDQHRGPTREWVEILQQLLLSSWNVRSEYYVSPGSDISAACGMFMTDAYLTQPRPAEGGTPGLNILQGSVSGDCVTTEGV